MTSQGKFIPKPHIVPQGGAAQAEAEFKSKFPNARLSSKDLLRRKVSSQGGKQYFDSGDYVMKKKLPGPSGGPNPPHTPSLLGVGTEVATVDNIPMRKTSQKAPMPITSPQRSSNLVSTPITSSSQTDPHRDLSPMATNPPSNPLTRHHMPSQSPVAPVHQPFHARTLPQTVTMKPPIVSPMSPLITSPPRSESEADTDDMV